MLSPLKVRSKPSSRVQGSLLTPAGKLGMSPGTAVHVGDIHQEDTRIQLWDYSASQCQYRPDPGQSAELEDLSAYLHTDTVTWILVEGLADTARISQITNAFGVHPLTLEDILNTHQRPKLEDHGHYLFIVMKNLAVSTSGFSIDTEQVSLLLMPGVVCVFKEKSDDLFATLVQRLNVASGRLRSMGADYTAYAIIDVIVDHWFPILDVIDGTLEALEDRLLQTQADNTVLHAIQHTKWELIYLRKNTSPARELVAALLRSDSPLLSQSTDIYLHDLADHLLRVSESIEIYREIASGLLEIYISSVSNRMNEVMKVLTIFASIFIPLTFIAGIYGMNFDNMPELHWAWGYRSVWIVFGVITVALLAFFKKQKWL